MILDLNKLKKKNNIQTDVGIVGGGTVGMYLAQELKKKKVVVIERGKDLNDKFYKSNYKFNKLKKIKDLQETYHPSGTVRIGTNKNNSCCKKNLRYWERDNLFICSTAVFPGTGSANTGYTLLALASRLANHLIKKKLFFK